MTFAFGDEARETSLFVDKMDKFFDTFNVSSFNQGKKARKPFQQPYRKPKSEDHEDFRLKVCQLIIYGLQLVFCSFVSFLENFLIT